MSTKTNVLLVAAIAGMSLGSNATSPAQEAGAGQPAGVKCYGINGCGANASCAVKADDISAVRMLLGNSGYKAKFSKSKEHSCKAHASCGASNHILNWTPASLESCTESHGIVIEDSEGKKTAKQL